MSHRVSLYISGIPQTENGTNGKWQSPFVCCKWKTETANFRLFAANGLKMEACLTEVCLRWSANDKR
jgi:hypothetical protein